MNTVYLVSGTLGAGKSTVSRLITAELDNCKLITGDDYQEQTEKSDLSWQDRLDFSWRNILRQTKSALSAGQDVVIDFVVENELYKFRSDLKSYDCRLIYAVLIASQATLLRRLEQRGDTKYQHRSFELLEQLSHSPQNIGHLIDTTSKDARQITNLILNSQNLAV